MRQIRYFAIALLIALSCGGKQSVDTELVGTTEGSSIADDLDVPEASSNNPDISTNSGESTGDAGVAAPGSGVEPMEATAAAVPRVTFKLKNSADEDLVFSVDRGWQPVIFAYSGVPPNAKAIVMFAKFCTAECGVDDSLRCPYCPQPQRVKQIREAEKREVVAPGQSLDVSWDGEIFVYEKTSGMQDAGPTECECYRKEPVPPNSYTVRACGLRITRSAKASSKYQCVEGSMSFPAQGPQVVELEFPAP